MHALWINRAKGGGESRGKQSLGDRGNGDEKTAVASTDLIAWKEPLFRYCSREADPVVVSILIISVTSGC